MARPEHPHSRLPGFHRDGIVHERGCRERGGRLTGKISNNGVLGNQPDAIEQARLGAIHFGEVSLGPTGQPIPETPVGSLPIIFKSIAQM
ncbi:MAG: hypothetical protein R3E68_19845 [Burkholderiaceae bacterium]